MCAYATAGPSRPPNTVLTMLLYSVILRDITFDNNQQLRAFKSIRPELLCIVCYS